MSKITLFNDINFSQFVGDREIYLKGKILSSEDPYISSIIPNIDKEIDKLIDSCDLVDVPILKKDEIKRTIKKVLAEDEEEFSGISFPGTPIEVAIYNVPFKGNQQFFKCNLRNYDVKKPTIRVDLTLDSLIFKFYPTRGENITGNSELIKEFKSSFSKEIKIIEDVLQEIRKQIGKYRIGLKEILKTEVLILADRIKEEEELENQRKNSEGEL